MWQAYNLSMKWPPRYSQAAGGNMGFSQRIMPHQYERSQHTTSSVIRFIYSSSLLSCPPNMKPLPLIRNIPQGKRSMKKSQLIQNTLKKVKREVSNEGERSMKKNHNFFANQTSGLKEKKGTEGSYYFADVVHSEHFK